METLEKKIGFNYIKSKLIQLAIFDKNKSYFDNLTFSNKRKEVEDEINISFEGLLLIKEYQKPNFVYFKNIDPYFEKVEKNSLVSLSELYNFLSLFNNLDNYKKYINKIENLPRFKYSNLSYKKIKEYKMIKELFAKSIKDEYNLEDTASPQLYNIRKQIQSLFIDMDNKISDLAKKYKEYLSEDTTYIKDQKLTLGVKKSYKNKIGGFIVDTSSSGNSVFIEPTSIYKMKSKLYLLKKEEKEEEKKIILKLNKKLKENLFSLKVNYEIIISIERMFAKGSLGLSLNANKADSGEYLKLKKAHFPLLDKKESIDNDFDFSEKKSLLISGPNFGGKTVALKTIALLSYMHQCGLLVPVEENSTFKIFDNFFVDIGDDQSIQNAMSSFSSHIKNLDNILKNASTNSLVVIDEIGNSTNPKDGEALGISILDELTNRKACVIMTTHFDNLKKFAIEKDNILVGAMEFDSKKYVPTYKLRYDILGESFAFEMAHKFNLDIKIINKAKHFKQLYMSSYEKNLQKLENKISNLNNQINKTKNLNNELKQKTYLLEKEKNQILKDQKEKFELKENEFNAWVVKQEKEVKNLFEELKKQKDSKFHKHLHLKDKLESLKIDKKEVLNGKKEKIDVGDYVLVKELNVKGEVKSIDKKNATILANNKSFKVNKENLVKKEKETKKEIKTSYSIKEKSKKNVDMKINLIGKTIDESHLLLDEYLDKALLFNYESITIIHGFGTGALKKGINKYLKTKSFVKHFESGSPYHGGRGTTIVYFKKREDKNESKPI